MRYPRNGMALAHTIETAIRVCHAFRLVLGNSSSADFDMPLGIPLNKFNHQIRGESFIVRRIFEMSTRFP